jgi:hypothetical protein
MARQRLGLRQPSAAISPARPATQSGRGLPQSKTSRNFPIGLQSQAATSFKMLQGVENDFSTTFSCENPNDFKGYFQKHDFFNTPLKDSGRRLPG